MSWSAAQESAAFQCEHHLVNGGRGDGEEPLHVGLSGRAGVDLRIGMNERKILPLSFGELHGGAWGDRHGAQSMIDCLLRTDGDPDEHTIHR